jgi:D-lactate dehydrogenase
MKIAIFSSCPYDEQFLSQFNTDHQLTFFTEALSAQSVVLTTDFQAVCLFVNDRADEKVIEQLEQNGVRLILLRCAGFNNINLAAAAEAGIKVLRVPTYSPEAVAEHAMAMVLTLNRKTHKAHNRTREGNFALDGLMGFNLHGAKVALMGTGNIGKAFYRILMGFGCKVTAYDPYPDVALQQDGLTYAPFADAIKAADIVSLHCPLSDDNHHMVNSTTLELFKDGAMLINTSRGGLIDTPAVIDALKSKKLGYLGIDVYEQESKLFFKDHSAEVMADEQIARLLSFPNVLITSHQGFFTAEAMEQIARTTFANADSFIQGAKLENEVYE